MTMRLGRGLMATLFLAGVCGCGGGSGPSGATASLPSKPGTHGGTAFPLPDNAGYAEVVIEPMKATPTRRDVVFAVYFLKPDLATELTPPPSTVKAKLTVPGSPDPMHTTLAAKPAKAGDGRFSTEVGNYDYDEIHGELIGDFGGKPFTIRIAVR